MSTDMTFYLTSVAAGLVLAHSPNGQPSGVVAQNKGDQDDAQKWTVEYGDEPDTVAMRCRSNGEYLRANGGENWATVGTGEKQWWKIANDEVTPPHACRLSPVDFPNVFLNHFQGQRVPKGHPGMKVHMWQWEQPHEFCLAWYFMDADGSFGPRAVASSGDNAEAEEAQVKLEDLQNRENALVEKEKGQAADLQAKLDDLQKRENALAQREQDQTTASRTKMEEFQHRDNTLAQREQEQTEIVRAKTQEFQHREAALVQREQSQVADFQARFNAIKQQQSEMTQLKVQFREGKERFLERTKLNSKGGWDIQAHGVLREFEAAERAAERGAATERAAAGSIKQRGEVKDDKAKKAEPQRELEATGQGAAPERTAPGNLRQTSEVEEKKKEKKKEKKAKKVEAQHVSTAKDNGATKEDLSRVERDNANLQLRLSKLEEQLAQVQRAAATKLEEQLAQLQRAAAASASDAKRSETQQIPTAKGDNTAPVSFKCGHTVYPPPRKLRRRMIGILYE